jgi:plastocyanin domain-containing protein
MIGNRQQLITVKIRKGYYTPNTFTVKQGVPVVVVFSGVAHGCLSRPTFKFLGKVGELRNGSATVDLGPLDAGVYTFTCSMGQNVGVITVR